MVKLFNATTLVLTTLSHITGLSGPKGVAVNSAGTLIYVVSYHLLVHIRRIAVDYDDPPLQADSNHGKVMLWNATSSVYSIAATTGLATPSGLALGS